MLKTILRSPPPPLPLSREEDKGIVFVKVKSRQPEYTSSQATFFAGQMVFKKQLLKDISCYIPM